MSMYVTDLNSTPPSINRVGSRGGWRRWHRLKKAWQQDLGMLLLYHQVPKDLERVVATATLRFPTRRRRDSDNFAPLLAKALGDALVTGGHLPDDTADRYRFEPVVFEADTGPARTILTLEATP